MHVTDAHKSIDPGRYLATVTVQVSLWRGWRCLFTRIIPKGERFDIVPAVDGLTQRIKCVDQPGDVEQLADYYEMVSEYRQRKAG